MKHMPWFRFYTEWVHDPKVQTLDYEQQRHMVALMCLKGDGTIDSLPDDPDKADALMAYALGVTLVTARDIKKCHSDNLFLSHGWQIRKWSDRQYRSDSSRLRTRKYREKLKSKNGGFGPKTSHHSHSDVTETVPESDTDTDTDTDNTPIPPLLDAARQHRADMALITAPIEGLNMVAWQSFVDYRKRIRKPIRELSYPLAMKSLVGFGDDAMQLAVVNQTIANGWQGLFELKRKVRGVERKRLTAEDIKNG